MSVCVLESQRERETEGKRERERERDRDRETETETERQRDRERYRERERARAREREREDCVINLTQSRKKKGNNICQLTAGTHKMLCTHSTNKARVAQRSHTNFSKWTSCLSNTQVAAPVQFPSSLRVPGTKEYATSDCH